MSVRRVSAVSLSVAMCMALLAAMLPGAALAQGATVREYIVTLDVQGSNRNIKPDSRANKVRIRQRAKAASAATDAVTKRQGVKAGHRYGNAVTGFSARMTRGQARKLAKDPSVSSVRVARTFKVSGESVPSGIKRVKAYQSKPQPDVDADVAIIDSGVGPAFSSGQPMSMTTNELNIAGGINCDGGDPGNWGDVDGHGTHVAGTVGARNNAVGVVGVAPGASLWSVRVLDQFGRGTEAAVLCGLDWIAGTHTDDTPDIDVVNMSLEGRRTDGGEEDCALITSELDPIHKSICTLKGMGVPVVASAGNAASDANDTAPGGYDQAITVGAMTDTDGKGRQQGVDAGCSWGREADDTYASYSNYGPDVDIVAPGTCVWSTWYGDRSGAARVRMSGTSMAAPHVTGAIARYIDAQGNPSTVGEIRQLIRAAGRMDWRASTDPFWSGVGDDKPPNRVLDVAALSGGHSVKTFVYHQGFKVGGTDDSRTTRVDVQRGGGYAGQLNLSLSGLPGAAGSASFDDSGLTGLGQNDLGTNLVFALDPGHEGIHDVDVTANGSGASSRGGRIKLTIDRTPPRVLKLGPKIRARNATVTRKGTTLVKLQWNPKDALSGVRSAQLQRRIGGGGWFDAGTSGKTSGLVSLKPGQDNDFRVRATDKVGNVGLSTVVDGELKIRDSKSGAIDKSGAWKNRSNKGAYGGSLLVATKGTPTLKTAFRGKAVAILAPVGKARGTFRVRVDGGKWSTVKTKAPSAAQRKVVWSRRLDDGNHRVVIQRLSGRLAIDGVIFVR